MCLFALFGRSDDLTFSVSCHCRVPEHENYASSLRRDPEYTPTFNEDVEDPEDFEDLEDEVESAERGPSRRANDRHRPRSRPRRGSLHTRKHLISNIDGVYEFQADGLTERRGYIRLGKNPATTMNGLFNKNVCGKNVMLKVLPGNELFTVHVGDESNLQMTGGLTKVNKMSPMLVF